MTFVSFMSYNLIGDLTGGEDKECRNIQLYLVTKAVIDTNFNHIVGCRLSLPVKIQVFT